MSDKESNEVLLSREQRAAVDSDAAALVVIASAGSGKTEVIARRVERLLRSTPGEHSRVLALSYTVKAAEELKFRLKDRLGALAERVDAHTIHGFAHDLIRQHGTKMGLPSEPELLIRDEDRIELVSRWLEERGTILPSDGYAYLRNIDLLRAKGETSADVEDWRAALSNMHALDYAELLHTAQELLGVRSVRKHVSRTYSNLIIDEAQNLSKAQYSLISSMLDRDATVPISSMFVGDDKQSIVSFAGADPRLIARYELEFGAERIALSTNFRSATKLSTLAHRVAEQLGHAEAENGAHAAEGQIGFHEASDEAAEASYVADWVVGLLSEGIVASAVSTSESRALRARDIAVLGRSATALRHIGPALERRGVAYSIASASSDWLESTPGKVVLEMIALRSATEHSSVHWQLARLLGGETDSIRSIEQLQARLGDSPDPFIRALSPLCDAIDVSDFNIALAKLEIPQVDSPAASAWQADSEQLQGSWTSFSQSVDRASRSWGNFKLFCSRQQRGDGDVDGVKLLTIHKAQGSEFKVVVLVGLNDGQLPDFRARTQEEERSELRTFYVAVTRARRVLLLTRPTSRRTNFGPRRQDPSRFLSVLEQMPGIERF